MFSNSFSAGRDYECQIVLNNIWFQIQKQLATLSNIKVLLKSVLIDLRACNFVQVKTSLRARSLLCAQFVKPWKSCPSP